MNFKKRIPFFSLILTLWAASAFSTQPKRHPLYPEGSPRIAYQQQFAKNLETVIGECKGVPFDQIQQSVYINLPGFYLTLENKAGEKVCSTAAFPIRVGRHWKKHFGKVSPELETPVGVGKINEKKWRGTFRYLEDVWREKCVKYEENEKGKKVCVETEQILVHRQGEVIRETSTYTDEGKPIRVPIEYDWMHALGMKIFSTDGKGYTTRCVIHATTDSHTMGNAVSHCCVGLRIDDLLKLYGLVVPELAQGKVNREVSLRIEYKVVEQSGEDLVLHADVYDRKEDYISLVKEALGDAGGYTPFDEERLREEIRKAEKQFAEAYPALRKKLLADKFISREEAGRLHYKIPLKKLGKSQY